MSTTDADTSPSAGTDADRFFDVSHLRDDLRGRSVRGGAITLIAQASRFTLYFASTILLARLLSPEEFGVVAMVVAITSFVQMFKDMGLSMATVQREQLTHAQVSTLFWINVCVSLVLCGVTAALAPAVAWFYAEPRLVPVTLAIAGAFVFSGLIVQHQALLRRHMRFRALAAVDISATAVSFAVAVGAALSGWGYWSLVLIHVTLPAATALGVWCACPWRPGRPVRGSGVRSLLAFGGYLTGFSVVNCFARNLDRTLIGWRWGATSVGLYSRAYALLLLPIAQVTPPIAAVAIPSLSRLQHDAPRYRSFYLRALSVMLFMTTPLTTLLIVAADESIAVLLGPQWSEAANIFRCLAAGALVQPLLKSMGWIYVSGGRTRTQFAWGVAASAVICLAFVIGLPWGPTGVAACYAVGSVLLLAPGLYVALRPTSISLGDVVITARAAGISALVAGLLTYAVRIWLCPGMHAVPALILMVVTMASSYLILVLFAFGKLDEYRTIFQEIRRKRG